jgi:hypothetical protein
MKIEGNDYSLKYDKNYDKNNYQLLLVFFRMKYYMLYNYLVL